VLTQQAAPFKAGDSFQRNIINIRRDGSAPKGPPILLVHGTGVRANVFAPPVQTTFVDYLIEHGYDVWLENWRASIGLVLQAKTMIAQCPEPFP
jgi:hypothetical protein